MAGIKPKAISNTICYANTVLRLIGPEKKTVCTVLAPVEILSG